jgi:hypothetical protein
VIREAFNLADVHLSGPEWILVDNASARVTPRDFGIHSNFLSISMSALERMLNQSYLDRPVVNRTGLEGLYAMALDVPFPASATGSSDPTGHSVEQSLKQHGLQLSRERGSVEKFVIDAILKEPTENESAAINTSGPSRAETREACGVRLLPWEDRPCKNRTWQRFTG